MSDAVKATYAYLPSGSGDGYGYGGGAIVNFNGVAIFFGEGNQAHKLAKFVADAVNAFAEPLPDDADLPF